ncbi:MAG: hypothetical protein ACPGGN_06805 [Opitutales bacterium]
MRKLLNNPAVVLPLACIALLWVAHSYGLSDFLLKQFFGQSSRGNTLPFEQKNKSNASTKSEKAMETLIADRWLISAWARASVAKNEPFVANGLQSEVELPTITVPEIKDEEMVIVDKETFDAALVSTLGLDQEGYFVVFENVLNQPIRKRVGDVIYLQGSGPLMIPTFGIAETRRNPAEFKAQAASIIAGFKLLGVGTENVQDSGVASSQNTNNIAFIEDADGNMGIFKQGQLVHRNPNLGLDQIFKDADRDRVILIDPFGSEYELISLTETRKLN